MKRLLITCLAAALFACEPTVSTHPILKYYPEVEVFEEGFVSKYYYHYYPDNPDQRAATRVVYSKFRIIDEKHFTEESYNAGYDLEQKVLYEVAGDTLKMKEQVDINSRDVTDTTSVNILSQPLVTWNSQTGGLYQLAETYNDVDYLYTSTQKEAKDTIVEGKQAKQFVMDWTYTKVGSDSVISSGTSSKVYALGLGYYSAVNRASNYQLEVELVEQMSVEEFEKRAAHGEHRVAWIDPSKSISDDSDFRICGHERNIADYYNSTPDGRYIHNKHAMVDTIEAHLDKSKLFDQNGRLVFRFVVNCNGEAGRFVAEGYDLDYQPMDFEQETIDHLFEVLQKLKEWRPVVLQDEPRDAYFYITFNFIDGEITDILP